jgi:hypothetical protein
MAKKLIATPQDLAWVILHAPEKDVRQCLLRIAEEFFMESEDGKPTLNSDKELDGADFIDEVRTHLDAFGFVPSTVTCSVCGNQACAGGAHLHQDKWIGECCWDEKLKASE